MKRISLILALVVASVISFSQSPIGFRKNWAYSGSTPPPVIPSGGGLDSLAVSDDTTISAHIGNAILNEMDLLWIKPDTAGATPYFWVGGDDKGGFNYGRMNNITDSLPRNQMFRVGYFRYMALAKDEQYWYAQGSEEGYPYGTMGSSLLKCRFHPENIKYSSRIFRPTIENVANNECEVFTHYWDGNVAVNPINGQKVWVYQKWKTGECEPYTAARIMVSNDWMNWTEINGDIIDSATANTYPMSWDGYQGDPKIFFTPDNRAWLFLIHSNGFNTSGVTHAAAFCEIQNVAPYKRIGPMVRLHQATATGTPTIRGSAKYIHCDRPVPPTMLSNHQGNELGIHEPTPIRVGNRFYIYMPHAGDKNNPYSYDAGGHVITLPVDSMAAGTPTLYTPTPSAKNTDGWFFNFIKADTTKAFTSETTSDSITGEWHSEYKFKITRNLSDSGLVFSRDVSTNRAGYFQVEVPPIHSNKYEVEIKFHIPSADIHWLLGDFPFTIGSDRSNTVRLNYDQVQIMHEDGQAINWFTGFSLSRYGQWTVFKIVNNGSTAELFLNGVSQGTRTSPTSKIKLSILGAGTQAGLDRPNPALHFMGGTVEYVKFKELL